MPEAATTDDATAAVKARATTVPGRTAADRKQQAWAVGLMREDPVGPATDDRFSQGRAFTGMVYLAIRKIYESVSAATCTVTEYRPRTMTTASAPAVKKSMPTPGGDSAQDQDYSPVPFDNPLAALFRRVNGRDTLADFLTDWVISENLYGSAPVWLPPLADRDEPAELWILPVPYLTPIAPTEESPAGGWLLNNLMQNGYGFQSSQGSITRIDGSEVIRSRHRNPLSPWDGHSPLTAFGRQIDVQNAIEEARKAAMDNEADPSVVFSLKGASQEEMERFTEKFTNRHVGAGKRRKVAAVDADSVTAAFPTRSPKDADYASGYDQSVKAVLAMFGVPPSVAGLNETGSYSALYAAKLQFYELTIKPLCKRISDFLTKHLAHTYYGEQYRVRLDVPPPNDEQATRSEIQADRSEIQADVASGLRTVNEGRTARGLRPVEGGDLPMSVYLDQLKAKLAPAPAPDANADPAGAGAAPDAPPKSEAATGGPAVPKPGNAESAGSKGPTADRDTAAAAKAYAKSVLAGLTARRSGRFPVGR